MASNYSQRFTLFDLFNNKALRNKLPQINYKETELDNGKISVRTSPKSVNRRVFDVATSSARPFYKPLYTKRSGDIMYISGTLVGDHDQAVDAIYTALMGQKQMLSFTANNASIIRDAMKEMQKSKRKYGIDSKLYLRANSMQQIMGMNKAQLQTLVNEVMENILYGDNFPATQKKYNAEEIGAGRRTSYQQNMNNWKRRVGIE